MNKKLLTAAIASALAAPMAAQAVDYSISGHVNRAIRYADDGTQSGVAHVDTPSSMSRLRIKGSGDLGNGMKAGLYVEGGMMRSNSAGGATIKQTGGDPGANATWSFRHNYAWFSGSFGKVSMGHTSDAADGGIDANLTGTCIADCQTSGSAFGGAIAFRTNTGVLTGMTVAGVAGTTEMGGRRDVLKYDSPAFGPATLSLSVSGDEQWAAGLYTGGDVAGGQYAFNASYTSADNARCASNIALSGAFKFSQGTNLYAGYSEQDAAAISTGCTGAAAAGEPQHFVIGLGHKWGSNAVSVSYTDFQDTGGLGVDAEQWGIGFVHTIPKAGVDLYASYHNVSVDLSPAALTAGGFAAGTGFDNIDILLVGTRVSFN